MLQHEIYERARLSRDPRFDGQFFVAVRTTGIYCRPICPAVAPKSENVSFFPTAAAAGEAGFRPCLRCRPECAPGTPAWNGTSTTVRRGLRLISSGALDGGSIEQLAERLGVTSRHLRRLFAEHVGASPLAVAHTQRLHFAKRLIDQTLLPLSEVAHAAGYGSVRRFNDTFRKTYGRTPRELRQRTHETTESGTALTVHLNYRKPFDWSPLLEFFAGRATPGVEGVFGDRYYRTIRINGRPGVIECSNHMDRVFLTMHGIETNDVFQVVRSAREMLDLDAPIGDIHDVLRADQLLAGLLRRHPGVRVPGAWDGFELTVRAILGQQVSVKAATTLAGRIAARYGEKVELPQTLRADYEMNRPDGMSRERAQIREKQLQLNRLFPAPDKLARARLIGIGLVKSRAETIRRVAAAVVSGDISFDEAQDPDELRASLMAIRGIGEWTAEYVVMRALKYPDAFPASDLGLLKAIDAARKPTANELKVRAQAWRPWRAYAALLLWGSLPGSGG